MSQFEIAPDDCVRFLDSKKQIRILCFHTMPGWCWVIDIDDPKAYPYEEKIDVIEGSIKEDKAEILDDHPHDHLLAVKKDRLTGYIQSDALKIWECFEQLLEDLETDEKLKKLPLSTPFTRKGFRIMVRLLAERTGFGTKCCKKHYRRLLQFGFKKGALVDRRSINSGAPNKPRKSRLGVRLGTWRREDRPYDNVKTGIPITDRDKQNFNRAVKAYYKKDASVQYVYDRLIESFYSDESYETKDGIKVPDLKHRSKIPSIGQFRYWLARNITTSFKLKRRKNIYFFNSNNRAFLGVTQDFFSSPLEVAIDSTTLHLNLTNPLNPNEVLKEATLFIVFCPADMTILGFFLTVEGEKYETAILALENAFTEKVSFYKKFGLEIEEEDFPFHHACTMLFADRAPYLFRNQSDDLQKRLGERHSLGFMIVNSNSFGPEKKGALENAFKIIEQYLFSKLPGFQKGRADFGDKNQRPNARLSYEALVRLIAKEILEYNNTCWLENYPLTEGMIADDLDPIPTQLRLWLIKEFSGKLPKFKRNEIQLELLLTGYATVKQNAILFSDKPGGKKLQYYCVLAEEEEWFIDAGSKGSFDIEVSYHPMWPNRIFIRPNKTLGITKVIVCELIDNAANRPFFDKPFYQINSHNSHYKLKQRETEDERAQSRAERRAYRDNEVRRAEEHFKENDDGRGNDARMANMKENTANERERLREVNRWEIFQGTTTNEEPQVTNDAGNRNEYIPPDDSSDLIRRKIHEKLNQQQIRKEDNDATNE